MSYVRFILVVLHSIMSVGMEVLCCALMVRHEKSQDRLKVYMFIINKRLNAS